MSGAGPSPGPAGPVAPANGRPAREPVPAAGGDGVEGLAASLVRGPSLPPSVLLAYALPGIGINFAFVLMGLYYFKFATDVLLVGPAVMGGLVAAGRLWDGFSDPIAGYLSDRTRSRLGRRRSWIAAAALPFALSILMLWSPPPGLPPGWTPVWVGAGLLFFYSAYTALAVPYGALGAELSRDYHDRTRLFAYRQAVGAIGMAVAIGGYYLLLESERGAAGSFTSRQLGFAIGLFAAVTLCGTAAFAVARLREPDEHGGRGPERLFGAFGDVLHNPHARRLLLVQSAHYFSMASLAVVSPFLFQHVLSLPSWVATTLVAGFAGGTVLAIPMWVRLSSRFGKDRCWRVALVASALIYVAIFFPMRDFSEVVPWVLAAAVLSAALLGSLQCSNFVLSHSMQADVIDYDEEQTGERKEGAYLAAWSLAEKCSAAIAAGLVGLTLEVVGYAPGAAQSEDTRLAILALMTALPATCHVLAAGALRGYALDEREHERIRTVLQGRRR